MFDLCTVIDEKKEYYIYGVTHYANYCFDKMTERFGPRIIKGFIQSAPQMEIHYGKRVYTPWDAVKNADDKSMYILAATKAQREMRAILETHGVSPEKIITFSEIDILFERNNCWEIKNICYWPPIEKMDVSLLKKIKWFVPDKIKVSIWTDNEEVKYFFKETSNIVIEKRCREAVWETSDYICVWDVKHIFPGLEKYREKLCLVDPYFHRSMEIETYGRLYYRGLSVEEREEYCRHSSDVFRKMQSEYKTLKRANVFCTGPSIEELSGKEYKKDFNIICNSMVKNKKWLAQIEPNLLAFGDVAFYFSPNDYSRAFHRDMVEAVNRYQLYIVIYEYQVPLFKAHFPALYERTIGLSTKRNDVPIFPTSESLYMKPTANICTLMMLPIASSLCDTIGIAGCTGRTPDETYFWHHSGQNQYLDLMHCVSDAYPAFFRDTKYDDYYGMHCKYVEEILQYGEDMGKEYINLTTSFIPALQKRSRK